MVQTLKQEDDERQREATEQQRRMEDLERQTKEREEKIAKLKAELQAMGLSPEQIDRATKKGSAFCSIM